MSQCTYTSTFLVVPPVSHYADHRIVLDFYSPMTTPTLKLNSGYDIPTIAFGTFKIHPNRYKTRPDPADALRHALFTGTWGPEVPQADISKAVTYAIKEGGYRHIDCAWGYLNEKAVGEGIKRSGIKREELFVSASA